MPRQTLDEAWGEGFLHGYNRAVQELQMGRSPHRAPFQPLSMDPPEAPEAPKKKKRRPSRYNREFARQYRAKRSKHPRMSHAKITALAHTATKKALK